MGTGYTTLRASCRGAEKGETETESKARPLKRSDAYKAARHRDSGDVAFARIFKIRSVKR